MPNNSNDNFFRTLIIGDVYGDPGLSALFFRLNRIKEENGIDFIIANGENAYNGFGISVSNMNYLFSLGVDVITSGNHIWNCSDIFESLDRESRILRPYNYGPDVPGHGYVIYNGVGVINLQGRINLSSVDSPFRAADECIEKIKRETNLIFVDFHAESAEEKQAMSFWLDGRVTAVVGTHTHVQTADEKILPNSTAYITDVGICGPSDSVIGCDVDLAIRRQITQIPFKPAPAMTAVEIDGVIIDSDINTGKAVSITRFRDIDE